MFTGGTIWVLTHGHIDPVSREVRKEEQHLRLRAQAELRSEKLSGPQTTVWLGDGWPEAPKTGGWFRFCLVCVCVLSGGGRGGWEGGGPCRLNL